MKDIIAVHRFNINISRESLLKCHLYCMIVEKGIYPEDSELNVLLYLYNSGPIDSKNSNKDFLKNCVELKLRRSEASTRNVLSKYTSLGILVKEKNSHRRFNYDLLPEKLDNDIVFQYLISNINLNAFRAEQDK